MEPTLFIINPAAGKSTSNVKRLVETFAQRHAGYIEIVQTTHGGHAADIARQTDFRRVVAVGGDGTVNEVINGIVGSKKTLGVIPAGSGNDFIKAIGLVNSVPHALNCLVNGSTATIDVGSIRVISADQSSSDTHFVNGIGVGFDATVAVNAGNIRYLTGTSRYLVAVMKTLGTYRAPEFSLAVNSRVFKGKYLLIAVGNGPCAGGGFYLTPDAKPNDGLLDVCLIDDLTIPGILTVMPKVMRGKHGSHTAVHFERGSELSISAAEPFRVHADGEILGKDVITVEVGIVKNGISVTVPGRQQQEI